MADYEQLMNLEKKGKPTSPPALFPLEEKPRNPETLKAVKAEIPKPGIPVSPKVGKSETPKPRFPAVSRVEKYTTQLEPSLIKQIKQVALEQDIKDYEVVQQAVKEFLARKR